MPNDDDDDGFGERGGQRMFTLWSQIDDLAVGAPAFVMILHVAGVATRNADLYSTLPGLWAAAYMWLIPFMIWRVSRRTICVGDPWRSAAILAFGALPLPLPFLDDTFLTQWPGLIFTLPLVVAWGATAQILAMRLKPPRRRPRVRAGLLGGGALIYAGIGVGAFLIERPVEDIMVSFLVWLRFVFVLPLAMLVMKLLDETQEALKVSDPPL